MIFSSCQTTIRNHTPREASRRCTSRSSWSHQIVSPHTGFHGSYLATRRRTGTCTCGLNKPLGLKGDEWVWSRMALPALARYPGFSKSVPTSGWQCQSSHGVWLPFYPWSPPCLSTAWELGWKLTVAHPSTLEGQLCPKDLVASNLLQGLDFHFLGFCLPPSSRTFNWMWKVILGRTGNWIWKVCFSGPNHLSNTLRFPLLSSLGKRDLLQWTISK